MRKSIFNDGALSPFFFFLHRKSSIEGGKYSERVDRAEGRGQSTSRRDTSLGECWCWGPGWGGGGSEAGRGARQGAAVRSPRETADSSQQGAETADCGLQAGEEASEARKRR